MTTAPTVPLPTISLLLDTDIGSDIDDAVALAYLLAQLRCEMLGITTVSGEPHRRAALARAVCLAAGRGDVPVHVGLESPLLVPPLQPRAPQAEVLPAEALTEFENRPTAVDFLRETIRARPGEITLLAIGPLTNLGVLFALDPELPTLLKQLVLMGGAYWTRDTEYTGATGAEWNMRCDPHAAALVFRAPVPVVKAVGLDVTTPCHLPSAEVRQKFASAGLALKLVSEMAEVWFRDRPEITFHDPLAAALIFEPQLCQWQKQHIGIDTDSPRAQGQTYFDDSAEGGPHEVAETVDAEAFFQHYFNIVRAEAGG